MDQINYGTYIISACLHRQVSFYTGITFQKKSHKSNTKFPFQNSIFPGALEVDNLNLYRVSQEECARLRESVPYVKLYRYNPKHLYPKLNGYGDNGQRSLKL